MAFQTVPSSSSSSSKNISLYRETVKRHIFEYGPVVSGFSYSLNFEEYTIAANIAQQRTESNPYGIFLEHYHYSSDKQLTLQEQLSRFKGNHSIVIIGWGAKPVSKTILNSRILKYISQELKSNPIKLREYQQSTIVDIPFWVCRNSWGEKTLVNIAMFPFNVVTNLEGVSTSLFRGSSSRDLAAIGPRGIFLFKAGKIATRVYSGLDRKLYSLANYNPAKEEYYRTKDIDIVVKEEGSTDDDSDFDFDFTRFTLDEDKDSKILWFNSQRGLVGEGGSTTSSSLLHHHKRNTARFSFSFPALFLVIVLEVLLLVLVLTIIVVNKN